MSRLTAADRRALPASDFGLPSTHGYPMPDRTHAELALSMAAHAYKLGHITLQQYLHIQHMAHAKLAGG